MSYPNNQYNAAPPMQPMQPMMPYQEKRMSVGEWVGTILLSGLGPIGLVLLFIWAFGDSAPLEKRNYAKAMLIIMAIGIGAAILLSILGMLFGVTMFAMLAPRS